jgi:hypothetical protein
MYACGTADVSQVAPAGGVHRKVLLLLLRLLRCT